MKKLNFLTIALLLLSLASCKLDGESYQRFYGKINIDSLVVQDSAFVGDTVFIYAQAGVPNGCYSDPTLFFHSNTYFDTLFLINAYANFESHDNICTDIYMLKDSTFQFIADSVGTFIFISDSEFRKPKYDTLVVVPKVGLRAKG